jgi:endothelin-converting enzyme/putative endopeptidase
MRLIGCLGAACLIALSPFSAGAVNAEAAAFGAWGVDTSGLSKSVRPGDDFYRYVNEGWLRTARIPTGLSAIDEGTQVYLANEQRVAAIIRDVRSGVHPTGSPEQQIADFYASHADMARRNALGLKPIESELARIRAAPDRSAVAAYMGGPAAAGLFAAGVLSDSDSPRVQIYAVAPSGLTMPSRDYYLLEGEPYAGFRKAFLDYVAGSFRRAGVSDPDARAARVLAFETEIARRAWTTEQSRDVVRLNRVMTPAELAAYAPGFDWGAFLAAEGAAGQPRLKVLKDSSVRDTARLWAETPVEDLKSWLVFHTLNAWADSLSEEWVQAHFDFNGKALKGIPGRRPAELETVMAVNGSLGEQLGRIYVARHFSAAERAQVAEMVDYLKAEFRDRIAKLAWMDAPTRAEAIAKLDKITTHIGYPDRWHDISGVSIRSDDLVGNQRRLLEWQHADELKKLAEGTRDWEFPYNPHEVNAGYSAALNSITFPAGILQPPFFDPKADPAVNFGAIAAIIGHEIGHGFDDQGSRQDGDGRIRNWWTPQSRAEFDRRTAGLVEQYNRYEPVPGAFINGRQNLGENIGDLGGLSVAHAAYRRFVMEKQGGKAPVIDGFSGDQRFFLSWAQIWRNVTGEAEERRRLLSDNHSPGEFRVNGVVRNVDAWYDAFGVKPADKLYLPSGERIRIW